MRSSTVQAIHGAISSGGFPTRGLLTCQRTGAGLYQLRVPPGRRLVGMQVFNGDAGQWVHGAVDNEHDAGARAVFANAAGTVNVDTPFKYIALLAI